MFLSCLTSPLLYCHYILDHLPSTERAWNLDSILLCLEFRILQFFTASSWHQKKKKKLLNFFKIYCDACLQIPDLPINVRVYLELYYCVWRYNFLDLFVCCHFKISDEVPVGLYLGQLCQLFTNSPSPQLKGEKQDIPGELVRAWICWHCVWTSGLCIFYVLGCLSVAFQTEKRPVLWVSTQSILVCGRWESWVTWLFEQERIHKTCFAKKQTWLFRTTCKWTQ